MPLAYSGIYLKVELVSRSPIVDNPGFGLAYSTTFSTATLSDVGDLAQKVATSMTAVPSGGTNSPTVRMSPVVSRVANSGTVTAYDITNHLDGTPHGSPIVVKTFTPGAAFGGVPAPDGCCAVITLQAPYGTDVEFAPGARPRARDRGRIYFGPISNNAIVNGPNDEAVFQSGFQTDLNKWIKSIATYTTPSSVVIYNLGVWSRKNAAIKSPQECWIDNRVDYQRRRSDQGTARLVEFLP